MDEREHIFDKVLWAIKSYFHRSRRCPSAELLGAYCEGTLQKVEEERVRKHLSQCDFCVQTLAVIDLEHDLPVVSTDYEAVSDGVSSAAPADDFPESKTLDPRIAAYLTQKRMSFSTRVGRILWPPVIEHRPRYAWSLGLTLSILLIFLIILPLVRNGDRPTGAPTPLNIPIFYPYTPKRTMGISADGADPAGEYHPDGQVKIDIPYDDPGRRWHAVFFNEDGKLHAELAIPPGPSGSSASLDVQARGSYAVPVEIGEDVKLLYLEASDLFQDSKGKLYVALMGARQALSPRPRKAGGRGHLYSNPAEGEKDQDGIKTVKRTRTDRKEGMGI